MNLPFDNVIHILEYVGDYENLLVLDKKTASIFQNIDLHYLVNSLVDLLFCLCIPFYIYLILVI